VKYDILQPKKYKKYYQWKLALPIILLNSHKQSKPKQIIFADRKNHSLRE